MGLDGTVSGCRPSLAGAVQRRHGWRPRTASRSPRTSRNATPSRLARRRRCRAGGRDVGSRSGARRLRRARSRDRSRCSAHRCRCIRRPACGELAASPSEADGLARRRVSSVIPAGNGNRIRRHRGRQVPHDGAASEHGQPRRSGAVMRLSAAGRRRPRSSRWHRRETWQQQRGQALCPRCASGVAFGSTAWSGRCAAIGARPRPRGTA